MKPNRKRTEQNQNENQWMGKLMVIRMCCYFGMVNITREEKIFARKSHKSYGNFQRQSKCKNKFICHT